MNQGFPGSRGGCFVAQESSEVINDKSSAQPLSQRLRLDLLTQRIVLVAVVVGIWWLSSLSVPHYILPGPARVWEALRLISAMVICGAISASRSGGLP